jgi:hypothetical protein
MRTLLGAKDLLLEQTVILVGPATPEELGQWHLPGATHSTGVTCDLRDFVSAEGVLRLGRVARLLCDRPLPTDGGDPRNLPEDPVGLHAQQCTEASTELS